MGIGFGKDILFETANVCMQARLYSFFYAVRIDFKKINFRIHTLFLQSK